MAVEVPVAVTRAPKSAGPSTRLAEVQALRMIAVSLVVVYHVWPWRIPSGFVGVDVFFVISGFLITAHLLREVHKTGTIKLSEFWARRIRRLLPASMIVLVLCGVLLWTVYPAVFRAPGMEQIAFAGAYALNWLLAANAVDYLNAGDSATLVQHFWSLSVEEQFYVVWPLLILVSLFLSARLWRASKKIQPATVVVVVTAVVVVASFVYSVLLSHYNPAFAYFDTGTRAWELGLGAFFAAALVRWPGPVDRIRTTPLVARGGLGLALGFVMIAASAFLIGPDREFPGWVAIFPTVGALLVIAVGMPDVSWLRPYIAWRPVQYIGDISYELYLVHWPLIVTFGVVFGSDPSWWAGSILIALSVLLARMLHRTVGALPRVWSAMWSRRSVAFTFAAVAAIVLAAGATFTFQWQQERIASAASVKDQLISAGTSAPGPGDELACVGAASMLSGAECPDRFAMSANVDLAAAASDLDNANWCLTWYDQDWLQCERGDLAAPNGTLALVGDSHAGALTGAMDTYFREQGWRVVTYTRFGCSGLERPDSALGGDTDTGRMWDACVAWGERVRQEVASRSDIDAVVLTNWQLSKVSPGPGLPARLTPATIAESLDELGATGKPLVFIEDPPNTGGVPVPECLAAATLAEAPCSTPRSERFDPALMKQGIAGSNVGVEYIPTVDAYCDAETCYSVLGGVVVYADNNHISDTWARSLMPYLGEKILASVAAGAGS